ncbi:HAMP domain-containing sensor histidine kinase [Mangrovibacter phragmitis]|uniref:sensor histidine kinase n=1 Tax=Mangrovibacter phragmitis TaxID=1691903 RepID=UPI00336A90CF
MSENRVDAEPVSAILSGEFARKLAARDKTIEVLKRRIARESHLSNTTPFAILEQNVGLEKVVALKTQELEKKRRELETALDELRITQSQLLQAQKMESIGQLAAGIAHEINTPAQYVSDNVGFVKSASDSLLHLLDAALILADSVREQMTEMPALQAFDTALKKTKVDFFRQQVPNALDESLEGLGRITKIVSAMKEFSHPSQNEKEYADIREIINTTITVARNEWKYVATLNTYFADNLPQVPCLRDMIGQVILNLVINAAHAIADKVQAGVKEKGNIEISVIPKNDYLEVKVKDDGTGIPENIRNRIFEPFFTTKAVGKGTGQGLAIVYSTIVDKHNGQIRCESEPGIGTTFIIELPLHYIAEGNEACK